MKSRLHVVGSLLCCVAISVSASNVVFGPKAEKGADDVPALIRALRAEKMGIRWNAALLLGEIGDESAVPALIKCAADDDNSRVRRRAFEALAKLGDTEAVPTLIKALNDRDRFVRRDAARALGELGDESTVPALIELLDDPEGFVRRDAVYSLGQLGDDAAIPALLKAAKERPEDYSTESPLSADDMSPVAREAYFALGKLGGDTAVPALAEVLKHHSFETRQRAVAALIRTGKAGVPVLTEALEDDNEEVRRAAIEALQEVGGSAGIEGLTEALEKCEEWARLSNTDFRQVVTTTRRERHKLAADRRSFTGMLAARADAIRALGAVGDSSVLPLLREELEYCREHENIRVQRLARTINAAIRAIESREED